MRKRINERYEIHRLLGEGGMGKVFLVQDRFAPDQEFIALKVFNLSGKEGLELLAWFKREFQTLATLRHPGLARVYDFGKEESSGKAFYTCEYVAGENLADATESLSFPEKMAILLKVCESLEYIHGRGILHNDLKPGNILIEKKTGQPKILDFGLSQALQDTSSKKSPASSIRWVGTAAYAAPELIRGESPSIQSDYFALGMIFYKILAGKLPHEGKTVADILKANLTGRFPGPRQKQPSLSRQAEALILHLISADPEKRPQSAVQIIEQMISLTGGQSKQREMDEWIPLAEGGRLYGRTEAWELLQAYSEERHPQKFAILFAESGMGKSALLTRLKHHVQLQEIPFLLINGRQYREAFGVWKRVVEELHGILGGEVQSWPLDKESLFFQTAEFLSKGFEQKRFFLAFDDAESLDEVSADFMRYLARLFSQEGISLPPCLVAWGREKVQEIFPATKYLSVALSPWQKKDCEEYLQDVFHEREIPTRFSQNILKHSAGNPQFVQEILRELVVEGILRRDNRSWNFNAVDFSKIRVPEGLFALCQKRFLRLSAAEKELLEIASLWEGALRFGDLQSLTGMEKKPCLEHLSKLRRQEILQESAVETWNFSQEIFAEMVRAQVSKASEKHRQIALYLEKIKPLPVEALAIHFAQAGISDQSAAYAQLAAQQAQRLFAQQRSLELYQLAYDQAKSSTQPEERILLAALLGKAEAHFRMGERKQSLDCYEQVLAHATADFSEEKAEALKALGIASRDQGEYDKALQYFARASETLSRKAPAIRASIQAQAALVYAKKNEHDRAKEWVEKSISLVSRDKKFLPSALPILIVAGLIAKTASRLDEAKKYYIFAYDLAKEKQDLKTSSVALNNLASLAASQKNFPEALINFQKSLELARKMGDAIRTCNALYNLGGIEYFCGNSRKALDYLREAKHIAGNLGDRKTLATILTTLGNLEVDRCHFQLAKDFFDQAAAHLQDLKDEKGFLYLAEGYINLFVHLGELKEAKHCIDQALSKLPEAGVVTKLQIFSVKVALAQGEFSVAERNLEQIKEVVAHHEDPDLKLAFVLAKTEWYLAKKEGRHAADFLQKSAYLKGKIHDPISWVRYRMLNLRAKYLILAQDSEHKAKSKEPIKIMFELMEEAVSFDQPQLHWQLQMLLGEFYEAGRETRMAIEAYTKSKEIFNAIAADLSDSWRKSYLADSEKQVVLQKIAVLSNTTEFHEQEVKALREEIDQLKRLLEINNQLVLGWKSREHLLEFILDTAIELMHAKRGFVVLKKDAELNLACARNDTRREKWEPEREFSRSIVQEVLATGVSQVVLDAGTDTQFKQSKSVVVLHLRSVACVPLLLGRKVIGALYLDHDLKRGLFSKSQVDLLQSIANQAALVLQQAETLVLAQQSAEETSISLRRAESLLQQQAHSLEWKYSYARIIGGKAPKMREVFDLLDRVIPSVSTVLIQGESGTGKELVAQAIHYNGPRKDKPFVSINCAALNPLLLESELFGHVKGAFTGAIADKEGLFVLAQGGSVFLDEIGDMPLDIQAKLLRVLEEREVRAVGSERNTKIDIRLIAASNKHLSEQVEMKLFREDLYYRLNVMEINLPALRDRLEDLDLLIDFFLEEFSKKKPRRKRELTKAARDLFARYPWPGNIRELRHVLESTCSLSKRHKVDVRDLPEKFRNFSRESLNIADLETAKEKFYHDYFQALMKKTHGNYVEAAKIAGIYRESLHRLLKKYGLKEE